MLHSFITMHGARKQFFFLYQCVRFLLIVVRNNQCMVKNHLKLNINMYFTEVKLSVVLVGKFNSYKIYEQYRYFVASLR